MSTLQTINIKHPSASTPTITFISSTNQATINAGSASAPVLSFIGDENTGVFSPGADAVSLATNGVERFRINSAGTAMIGDTSRNTVYVTSSFTPGFQSAVGSGTGGFYRYTADADGAALVFSKSRNATAGSHTVVNSGDTVGYIGFAGSDGTAFRTAATIFAQVDGTPGASDMPGRLIFTTTADGSATPTERMRIDSSGNVGIGGTAGIGFRLHVKDTNSQVVSEGTGGFGSFYAKSSGTNQAYLFLANATNGEQARLSAIDPGILAFSTGNGTVTERMRIDSSGQITIGPGSAAAPVLSFSGDTNTGVFSPGGDAVGISVGGVSRFQITAQGVIQHNNVANWNFSNVNFFRRSSNTENARFIAMLLDGDSDADTTIGGYNAIWGTYDSAPTTSSTSSGLNGKMAYGAYAGHRFYVNGTERVAVDTNGLITGTGTSLGAWTSYTPTLGGITLGNGSLSGRYVQIGKVVIGRIAFYSGSTTSFSGNITFSLPVTPSANDLFIGGGYSYDSSAGTGQIIVGYLSGLNLLAPRRYDTVAGYSATVPWTWAQSDEIKIQFTYEAS